MYASLKKLYLEFSWQEKRRLWFLAVVIVITALVQVVGIASIFPFISAAADPSIVDKNEHLLGVKTYLGIIDNRDFIVLLGGAVLLTLILTNAFLAFSTWLTMRFIVSTIQDLSTRMLKRYLSNSYLFHLEKNSTELLKNLTAEVGRVVNGGIMSGINVVSKGFTVICILLFLIAVDPLVALVMGAILGVSYGFIFWLIRLKLLRAGRVVSQLASDKMRCMNEALGGIKELRILGREQYYLTWYRDLADKMIKNDVFVRSAVDLPKFLLETIAFGGILLMCIYFVSIKDDAQNVLPMLSLYGFAGYRLMPALQAIYHGSATLKHDIVAVDLFYEDIKSRGTDSIVEESNDEELAVEKHIRLDNICFNYPGSINPAVNGLSLDIKAKTSVGIVGGSGSGKSTLIDIMLGLLNPQEGGVFIDDNKMTQSNMKSWRSIIGYVPQVIFLADTSVSENIAFGVPLMKIDQVAVERAAKMSNLHDFINEDLDEGYQTVVGERGARLSGGQRQRIGIARALYHNPEVLILDEATSALDSPTEKSIMDTVYELAHKKTIIMVAHRLSTIKDCDEIVVMNKGEMVDKGGYMELSRDSAYFKRLLLKDD